MNNDLNLLVTFYSTSKEMIKIALKVQYGMNYEVWKNWKYFREPDMEDLIIEAMPLHVRSFCEHILDVENIFEVDEVTLPDTKAIKGRAIEEEECL